MPNIYDIGAVRSWADDLWTVDGRAVPFFTVPYTTRMTLVRLSSGDLVVISPIRIDDCDMDAIDALGPVRHIFAPNKIHHLFLGEWAERYRQAKLYAAPGLLKKRRDLAFVAELGDDAEPAWAEDLDQAALAGSSFMTEIVFFHKASRTLIVTDCIQRFRPKSLNWIHRIIMGLDGMLGEHGGMPREWRASFRDRKRGRAAVEKMIAWDPQGIIIAHGDCVRENGGAYLRRAFRWLL